MEEAFTIWRLKQAGQQGRAQGISEGWSVYVQTKLSKINGPERSEWPDSHNRTRPGGFENLLYIETNWGGRSSTEHEPWKSYFDWLKFGISNGLYTVFAVVSEAIKPLQLVGQVAEFKFESKFEPMPVIWQSLQGCSRR